MSLYHQVALTLLVGAPLYAQQPGPQDMPQEMVWVDRSGDVIERVGAVQNSIFFPEISPDGRSIAVSSRDGEVNDRDVWIHDIAAATKRRVMEVKGNDNFPFWSPDGKEVAFTSSRTRNYELYRRSLASGTEDIDIDIASSRATHRSTRATGRPTANTWRSHALSMTGAVWNCSAWIPGTTKS